MGKAHINLWEGPLILFTPTGKDLVGWERPHICMGRTIDIFIPIGKDLVVVGKDH
jgi:hypothetical protein